MNCKTLGEKNVIYLEDFVIYDSGLEKVIK